MADISIITCTYNPDEAIFARVLQAISTLEVDGLAVEAFIIDNNSQPAIAERQQVKDFLAATPWATVIVEPKQGKLNAIRTGINHCTGNYIVNFDEDNEPDKGYLFATIALYKKYPKVAVWGPGKIKVEFMQPPPPWAYKYLGLFQQRDAQKEEFGCTLEPVNYFPFGTGMVCQKQVYSAYFAALDQQSLSIKGRQPGSLASADDVQLVYTAVKMGLSFGVAPSLQLTHLIPPKRTTIAYVKKLFYGCYSDADMALVEVFPEKRAGLPLPNATQILAKIAKISFCRSLLLRTYQVQFDLAAYLGKTISRYKVHGLQPPFWLLQFIKMLQLQ